MCSTACVAGAEELDMCCRSRTGRRVSTSGMCRWCRWGSTYVAKEEDGGVQNRSTRRRLRLSGGLEAHDDVERVMPRRLGELVAHDDAEWVMSRHSGELVAHGDAVQVLRKTACRQRGRIRLRGSCGDKACGGGRVKSGSRSGGWGDEVDKSCSNSDNGMSCLREDC